MIRKHISLLLVIFALIIILLPYPRASYAQQQQRLVMSKIINFLPFASLQFSPSSNDSIILTFRSAEFINNQNNQTLTVFAPTTRMNNIDEAGDLFRNDTVQPTFDSYFSYNRLLPQIMPKLSIISVTITHILNPEAQYITQTKLSNPINLASNEENVTKSFLIPPIHRGFYLAKLSVYFPEYKMSAVYSNSINIHNITRQQAAYLSTLSSSRGNFSGNTTS